MFNNIRKYIRLNFCVTCIKNNKILQLSRTKVKIIVLRTLRTWWINSRTISYSFKKRGRTCFDANNEKNIPAKIIILAGLASVDLILYFLGFLQHLACIFIIVVKQNNT